MLSNGQVAGCLPLQRPPLPCEVFDLASIGASAATNSRGHNVTLQVILHALPWVDFAHHPPLSSWNRSAGKVARVGHSRIHLEELLGCRSATRPAD